LRSYFTNEEVVETEEYMKGIELISNFCTMKKKYEKKSLNNINMNYIILWALQTKTGKLKTSKSLA
jgi:hypothetical protein